MPFVYILYSNSRDRFYKGQTNDLSRRVAEHNAQQERSTKSGVPWTLVWHTEVSTSAEAMKLEKKLKNITGRCRLLDFINRNS